MVTHFVDRLRTASPRGLDQTLVELRSGALASVESGADATDIMTHFYLSEPLRQFCESMPRDTVGASFDLFRPIAHDYSFELHNWLTYFVRPDGDGAKVTACGEFDGQLLWVCRFASADGTFRDHPGVTWNSDVQPSVLFQPTPLEAANFALQILCQCTVIVTVPGLFRNVKLPIDHKLQRARAKSGKPPLVEYVCMTIDRPKAAVGGKDCDSDRLDRVRHQVIGHFRLLTVNRPTPALSFVKPHWRGRAEIGLKIKDYSVGSSGHQFTPPSLTTVDNN